MLRLIMMVCGVSVQQETQSTEETTGEAKQASVDEFAVWIDAAKTGDLEAQNALAAALREPAFYFALQLLGNREDAHDITQDALLRFLGNLDRFESGRPVLPWLRRIVRNAVIDLQRRKNVRRADSLDSDGYEGEALEIVDQDQDAGRRAVSQERREIVWNSLGRLPEQHREIVVLREYQDLSYQEIADLLEVPIGTVMSRLHRARLELRSRVLEAVDESELESLL